MMTQVGIIGWRGMVGSVLLDRMREERDFEHISPSFFSTSQSGAAGPIIAGATSVVQDANDIGALAKFPILISTKAATTRRPFIRACVPRDGEATGSTPRRRCAWIRMP